MARMIITSATVFCSSCGKEVDERVYCFICGQTEDKCTCDNFNPYMGVMHLDGSSCWWTNEESPIILAAIKEIDKDMIVALVEAIQKQVSALIESPGTIPVTRAEAIGRLSVAILRELE